MPKLNLTLENEHAVGEYFREPGWKVRKLDTGELKAADYRVCRTDDCFLVEVKTVLSDRESRPSGDSASYYLSQRDNERAAVEDAAQQRPHTHVLLTPDQWEYLYGSDEVLLQRFKDAPRGTLKPFEDFGQSLRQSLAESSVRALPYMLRIDSDNLYVPSRRERDEFLRWLKRELQSIANGEASHAWLQQPTSGGWLVFSADYPIHQPIETGDWSASYDVTVFGPKVGSGLDVDIHGCGGLNLERVAANVADAATQLEASASREGDEALPRVAVIALKSAVDPEEGRVLQVSLRQLLEEFPTISAIALLKWKPDAEAPAPGASVDALRKYWTLPAVPTFAVFHNPYLHVARAVPKDAFWDKWSSHHYFEPPKDESSVSEEPS